MVGERWGISGEVQTARVAEGGGADGEEHEQEGGKIVYGEDEGNR